MLLISCRVMKFLCSVFFFPILIFCSACVSSPTRYFVNVGQYILYLLGLDKLIPPCQYTDSLSLKKQFNTSNWTTFMWDYTSEWHIYNSVKYFYLTILQCNNYITYRTLVCTYIVVCRDISKCGYPNVMYSVGRISVILGFVSLNRRPSKARIARMYFTCS